MNIATLLQDRNVEFEVIPHPETHDALRMASAIHYPGREVAKTVLLKADRGFAYIVAVLPADRVVDFELASKTLGGSKLSLAAEAEISRHCPDCEFGVLPPFGSQYAMQTLVDDSLAEGEHIVFEDTHHEAIRIKFEDYHRVEEPLICHFATPMHSKAMV